MCTPFLCSGDPRQRESKCTWQVHLTFKLIEFIRKRLRSKLLFTRASRWDRNSVGGRERAGGRERGSEREGKNGGAGHITLGGWWGEASLMTGCGWMGGGRERGRSPGLFPPRSTVVPRDLVCPFHQPPILFAFHSSQKLPNPAH